MAIHGKRRHWKRQAVPKAVPIARRVNRYLKKPNAGRHKLTETMPLIVLCRDVLGVSKDRRETKAMLAKGSVLVDGNRVKDEGFPLGLMDVASIPELGRSYRIIMRHHRLFPLQITPEAAKTKLCRVTGKKLTKNNKVQLQFHDGRTQLIEREEDRFKPGDTIKLGVPQQKIEGFMKLERGARCYVHKGKHAGEMAELQELLEREGSAATEARLTGGKGAFVTRKDYVFVVDDEFEA